MVDLVRPLKLENPSEGGSSLDFGPTECRPDQDYLNSLGVAFGSGSSFLMDKIGRVIAEKYPNLYQSASYNANKTINYVELYNSNTFITANRIARYDVSYNVNLTPSQETLKIYDTDGTTILRTFTTTYTYSGVDLVSSSEVIS